MGAIFVQHGLSLDLINITIERQFWNHYTGFQLSKGYDIRLQSIAHPQTNSKKFQWQINFVYPESENTLWLDVF